jgi:uncharacterized protein with FMN-binding domain
MKRTTIKAIPAVALAAVALQGGSAFAATSHTYKGPAESMRWGTVQVSIVVNNKKKITNVKVAMSTDSARSQIIESRALPTLKQEVLSAQSATINQVSGATDLFSAYVQSLQGAICKAQKAHTLK